MEMNKQDRYSSFCDKYGTLFYTKNGLLHRENKPAVITQNGQVEYYTQDNLHRENAPAIIHSDGREEYYHNGKPHRTDGPAVIQANGDSIYYQYNLLHRIDGPAAIYADGTEKYYQYNKKQSSIINKTCNIDERGFLMFINENGSVSREGAPAVIQPNGVELYFKNGNLHRSSNLPATITVDGNVCYYYYGDKHRDNGPAKIYKNGTKEYWVGDEMIRLEKVK